MKTTRMFLLLVFTFSGCAAVKTTVESDLTLASKHLHAAVESGILQSSDPVIQCIDAINKYLPKLPDIKLDVTKQITTGADFYIWGTALNAIPVDCKAVLFDIRMKVDQNILKMGLGAIIP